MLKLFVLFSKAIILNQNNYIEQSFYKFRFEDNRKLQECQSMNDSNSI
jgi:hypothetical protein